MEHRFCLDEILGKVSEMINDGYHYGSIDVLEDCLLDNGQHGAIMCFVADDEGGYKLLEIVGSDTLIVGVGEDDKPFVWEIPDRLHNALDFSCDTY